MKCKILFILLLFSVSGKLQSQNTMATAVDIGSKSASFNYVNTQSTLNSGNNYVGKTTNDVYHKFTLTKEMEIIISHCGSTLTDTYVYLLNSSGGLINFNDDCDGVVCFNRYHSYLKIQLAAGTYYIVSEGYSSNGSITVYVEGIVQASYSQNQNYILTTTYTNYVNNNASDSLVTVQYFDGLGRPVETVQRGITPAKADLVTFQEYDAFGRESNSWLPVVATGNNGAFITLNAYRERAAVIYNSTLYSPYPDSIPYSRPVYEASPLNRVLEQYGPGADWQKNGKAVKTEYMANTVTGALSCRLFTVTSDEKLIGESNYSANQLYVTKITDEDGNVSYEFKNKLGQVLLTRQVNNNQDYNTYYVYNDFGKICLVLPPSCEEHNLVTFGRWRFDDETLKDYAYIYKYDSRNRCIAKKLPGCEWIYYVYDKANRLIFTQDSVQRKTQRWTFSISDSLGRIAVTGTCKNSTMDYSANPLKDKLVAAGRTKANNNFKGYTIYGITIGSPADSLTILTVNYYDNYDFMGYNSIPANTDANIKYNDEAGYGKWYAGDYTDANKYKNKGLLTGTLTAQMNPDETIASTYLYSVMYYDDRGRIVQTKGNSHLAGGIEKEYIACNFTGQPTGKKHIHSATGKLAQTEVYNYTYDHAGRLKTTTHQWTEGATVKPAVIIAENTYDELGRLKINKKGGQANTAANYTYNIRSWVKSIGGPSFMVSLYYNESYDNNTKAYNGNISVMTWIHPSESQTRGYAFSYNNLSWLTEANYLINGTVKGNYNTSYTYDKQGNIKTLQRYGKTGASTYGLVDKLTMSYYGNQLRRVLDDKSTISIAESADFKDYYNNPTKEYTYNANGAMTQDLNKGISDIQYNVLNLPRQMVINSATARGKNYYTYSASGVKLRTEQRYDPNLLVSPVNTTTPANDGLPDYKNTDYMGNIIYETVKSGSTTTSKTRILIDGGYIDSGMYYYYQTDHLGNNWVVVNANGTIIQKNHYYPFGMAFAEPSVNEQNMQPYKYGNKELDPMHGLNQYDYSARFYDPAIARFTTMDPLAEKYYSISPYAYCLNNPVRFVDPDGMAVYIMFEDGRIVLALADQTDEDEKKPDYLFVYNKAGEKDPTTIHDKELLPQLAGYSKEIGRSAVTSNSHDAFNLFKVAADNSDVEWSLSGFRNNGNTFFYINTQYSEACAENGEGNDFFEAKDMLFNVHSHSTPDGTKGGSGYSFSKFDPNTGKYVLSENATDDRRSAYILYKRTEKIMPMYVYHRYSQGLYKYTPWKPDERKWLNIRFGASLKNIIYPKR